MRSAVFAVFVVCGCADGSPTPTPADAAATGSASVASAPTEAASIPAVPTTQPQGDVLVSESFDSAAALDGWKRMSGAEVAPAPENEVGWDDGAARMRASRDTRKWIALYREVDTGDASWVTLRAKIRVDGVDPTGAPRQNCNLFFKHGGGIGGTRVVSGTQTVTVRRRFEVKPGNGTLGFFCSMPGQAWFDDIALEKSVAPAWTETSHGHFRYRTLPGDTIDDRALPFNEESYRIMSTFFEVSEPASIVFMKYPDAATIEELTGRAGNAFREGPVMHSIFATDRHEIVHVLADAWGAPPALVSEGLAVFMSGAWQREPVREYARKLALKGGWHAPTSLLDSPKFRAVPDLESYAVGGAFIAWIDATHGKVKLRELYRKLDNKAPEADNKKRLEEVLGPSAEIDAKVRAWVDATPAP